MYSRMSWEATSGLLPIGAQHGRGRLMRRKRASSANGSASDGLAWRQPAWLSSRHLESHFFKSVLSRDVASGVKRTRHQLAPAVPGQKIIDRALAGFVPDGLFVGRLEIVDVQHFAGSGGLGKAHQQGFFLFQRHVLALASATGSRLERLDSAVAMCARFTVLSDTPIAAAIKSCVIPLSRSNTIWMRWRCSAGIFHRSAVFHRRTAPLVHS